MSTAKAKKTKAKKTYTAEEVADLLYKYGRHTWGCAALRDFERECNCGLNVLRVPGKKTGRIRSLRVD